MDKRSLERRWKLERFRKKIFLPRVSSKSSRDLRVDPNMCSSTCFCRHSSDRRFIFYHSFSTISCFHTFARETCNPISPSPNSNNHDCPTEKGEEGSIRSKGKLKTARNWARYRSSANWFRSIQKRNLGIASVSGIDERIPQNRGSPKSLDVRFPPTRIIPS